MNLYRTLRSLRDRERGIKPDAAWVHATRETLLMQVRNSMPTAELAAKYRVPVLSALYQRVVERMRGPVLAVTSIAGVVLGGSIASVSAAEQALPGDTLYAVKLVTEQARLAFAGTRGNKVVLKSAFTKRRVEELRAIVTSDVSEKNVRAALAADGLKRDLDTLKQQLTDVQNESSGMDAADAAKEVDKNAVEVSKTLAETKDAVPEEVKDRVSDAQQQAADVGIQALEVMVAAKNDAGESVVSAEDVGASLVAHAEVAAQTVAEAKVLAETTDFASSTQPFSFGGVNGTSTTPLALVKATEDALVAVQQLAGEQKLDEAVGLLKDATMKSLTLQKQVAQDVIALGAASSSSSMLPASSTSTTPSGVSTASSTQSGVSTSTAP